MAETATIPIVLERESNVLSNIFFLMILIHRKIPIKTFY